MKKFLLKIFSFFLVLFTFLNLTIIISDYILDDVHLDTSMEIKIKMLNIDTTKTNIIIAGDSRAERQLIPKIIKSKTGINTINIAVSGGDLVSTIYSIKKFFSNSDLIFVISASSWQINDGAIDQGYMSLKCFQKLTLKEKYQVYYKNLKEFSKLTKVLHIKAVKQLITNTPHF